MVQPIRNDECGVCYEVYQMDGDRTPVNLPCGHVLCQGCAKKIMQQAVDANENYWSCTVCRIEIPNEETLPKSFGLLGAIEQQKQEASMVSSNNMGNRSPLADVTNHMNQVNAPQFRGFKQPNQTFELKKKRASSEDGAQF